jgi:DNA repair protein RadC
MSSIHTGHRQRVKEEFLARGLEGLPDHRVLELLLFYAIPQGDVNPLAHELLDHFGSLSDVFHAPYEELLKVKGVGANTATLIQLVPALGARYLADRVSLDGQLTTAEDYMEVLGPYFFGARVEMCYLLCMDGKSKLITCRKLGEGIVDEVSILRRKVVETALACNASRVVLAHNHVSGVAKPSAADIEYTRQLRYLLREVSVTLVDHLVMVDGDMVSMAQSGYMRET